MRHLPAIELIRFDGSPAKWPKCIHSFHENIHSKVTFTGNIRMMRLISLLDGDAKKAVQSIGSSGLFYASALKSLKSNFGNPLLVATFRMKTLFDKPHINGRDRIALREYHQQLKMNNTWLISMGYETPLLSSDNLTKALMRLPLNLQQDFFKATRDSNLIDGSVNLIVFEKWLDQKLKTLFNPVADIIAANDTRTKRPTKPYQPKPGTLINSLTTKPDLHKQQKHDDSAKENPSSDRKDIKFWVCTKPHRLMDCDVFKAKSLDERKEYVKTEKLCFNCFSKGHSLKDCNSKYQCRVNNCNKKHHSLIHYETVSSNSLSIKEPLTNNNSDHCNKIN